MTAPDNPYFARAAVNRLWAYFFGTGLVEPVDEMVGANSDASHPELLDLLAREFAAHEFDMKFLIRAITATRAYQLTSAAHAQEPGRSGPVRPHAAARPDRRAAVRQRGDGDRLPRLGRRRRPDLRPARRQRSARSEFLTSSPCPSGPPKSQTSILQALSLMNGKVAADATSLERSETLAAVVDAPFLTTAERVETLYLATLSRKPEPKELTGR